LKYRERLLFFFIIAQLSMPKKPPRYSLSVQRDAGEQVVIHHRPVAQVARQLRCPPQCNNTRE